MRSRLEVAQLLADFLTGKAHPLAWDGFTLGSQFDDERLEQIRLRCAGLSQEFPPEKRGEYCNEQGLEVIRGYIAELRHS
jgi:hypothetical protein